MEPGIHVPDVTTDPEKILENNQRIRQQMVQALASQITVDPKMAKVVLSSMKDMDSQILTIKRLDQEEASSKSDRETAIMLHQQSLELSRTTGNRNPFERDDFNSKKAESGSIAKEVPNIPIVPGQLDQGTIQDNYENFISQFEDKS